MKWADINRIKLGIAIHSEINILNRVCLYRDITPVLS